MILCFATLCSDVVLAEVFVYPMADGIKKSSLFEIEVSDGGEFWSLLCIPMWHNGKLTGVRQLRGHLLLQIRNLLSG